MRLLAVLSVCLLAACAAGPKPLPVGKVAAVAHPGAEQSVTPPIAIALTQCGKAIALYVVIDDTHVLRFDQQQTTLLIRRPDGTVVEQSGPPTPFDKALELAQGATITSHAIAACDDQGYSI